MVGNINRADYSLENRNHTSWIYFYTFSVNLAYIIHWSVEKYFLLEITLVLSINFIGLVNSIGDRTFYGYRYCTIFKDFCLINHFNNFTLPCSGDKFICFFDVRILDLYFKYVVLVGIDILILDLTNSFTNYLRFLGINLNLCFGLWKIFLLSVI